MHICTCGYERKFGPFNLHVLPSIEVAMWGARGSLASALPPAAAGGLSLPPTTPRSSHLSTFRHIRVESIVRTVGLVPGRTRVLPVVNAYIHFTCSQRGT